MFWQRAVVERKTCLIGQRGGALGEITAERQATGIAARPLHSEHANAFLLTDVRACSVLLA